MGLSRAERRALHSKQQRNNPKKGIPTANELQEGVTVLRDTPNGLFEYVKHNGIVYKKSLDREINPRGAGNPAQYDVSGTSAPTGSGFGPVPNPHQLGVPPKDTDPVTTSAPGDGDIPLYNGKNWVSRNLSELRAGSGSVPVANGGTGLAATELATDADGTSKPGPTFTLKNTVDNAYGPIIELQNTRAGEAGSDADEYDNDSSGSIKFTGTKQAGTTVQTSSIEGGFVNSETSETQGKISLFTTTNNTANTQTKEGLIVKGVTGTSARVDVDIANHYDSLTTVAGTLTLGNNQLTMGRQTSAKIKMIAQSGSNTPGEDLSIDAGQGTGSGAGGDIQFKTAKPNSGGATDVNPLTNQLIIDANGDLSMNSARKFYFDGAGGGGDTYISEISANSLALTAGGSEFLVGTATEMRNKIPLRILEQAGELGTDVAGYGQLWVKNTTPNNLWFTDDTGQNCQITDGTSLAVKPKWNFSIAGYAKNINDTKWRWFNSHYAGSITKVTTPGALAFAASWSDMDSAFIPSTSGTLTDMSILCRQIGAQDDIRVEVYKMTQATNWSSIGSPIASTAMAYKTVTTTTSNLHAHDGFTSTPSTSFAAHQPLLITIKYPSTSGNSSPYLNITLEGTYDN